MRWLVNNKLRWHFDRKYKINWFKKSPSEISQQFKNFLFKHCKNNCLYEEYRIPGCLLRIDFLDATKKIAYEINGSQHESFNKFFFKNKLGYLNSIKRDIKKQSYLEKNGYKFVEIFETDFPLTKVFLKTEFNFNL